MKGRDKKSKLWNRIERFGSFCPFEALGAVHAEVRHAAFLASMLDPFRPHGYGSHLLRLFVMTAVRNAIDAGLNIGHITPLDIHLLELDEAEIRREWQAINASSSGRASKPGEWGRLIQPQVLMQLTEVRRSRRHNWHEIKGFIGTGFPRQRGDEEGSRLPFWTRKIKDEKRARKVGRRLRADKGL